MLRFHAARKSDSIEFDALEVHRILYPALSTIRVDSERVGIDCMATTELGDDSLEQLLSFIDMWHVEFRGAPAEIVMRGPEPRREVCRNRDEFVEKLDALDALVRSADTIMCEGRGPCLDDDLSGRHHPHSGELRVSDLPRQTHPLLHEFSYHPQKPGGHSEYWNDRQNRDRVTLIEGFVYAWIFRAASWIRFPAAHGTIEMDGLAMTGVTFFHPAGAARFGELCRAWSRAIGRLEPVFPLEQRWYRTDDKKLLVDGSNKVRLDRDEICRKLDAIAEMADVSLADVSLAEGNQLIHQGV